MKEVYKVAFWGAGKIASTVIGTIDNIDRLEKYAVATRSLEKAIKFAEEHSIRRALTFDKLLEDENIDLIYVTTPTKFHYEHIKRCLNAGKNVICEKPMVENEKEAVELVELAKEKNVLLIDGLWTMYMPIIEKLQEIVKELGDIKYASAGLGYPCLDKLADSVKASYELWDLEVYPLSMILSLAGIPDIIVGKTKKQFGIDIKNVSYLRYGDHKKCRIFSSIKNRGTYCLFVAGRKGFLLCRKYWFGRYPIYYYKFPFKFKKVNLNHKLSGYEYEFEEAIYCLDNNMIQSNKYDLHKTIELMKCKNKVFEKEEC